MTWTCNCCGKELPTTAIEWTVVNGDSGEEVSVGSDCGRKTREAGVDGYNPEKSDTTFYTIAVFADMED